jgi:hypothetical protein
MEKKKIFIFCERNFYLINNFEKKIAAKQKKLKIKTHELNKNLISEKNLH